MQDTGAFMTPIPEYLMRDQKSYYKTMEMSLENVCAKYLETWLRRCIASLKLQINILSFLLYS